MWTSLEPLSIAVDPGSTGSVTLRLRNDGDTVEEYRLSVIGAPAAWARVEPPIVRLYPGLHGQARVSFDPPRSPEATAGPTPYGIQVRPRQNPALSDVAEGSVVVSPFSEVRAELFPLTVRGRLSGRPGLSVRNLGNGPLSATLSARDDEDALTFQPNPPVLHVPAGRSVTSQLRISPRSLRLFKRAERYPYLATVIPSGPGTGETVDRLEPRGTFVRLPLLPRWLLLLVAALVVLVALGSGIYFGVICGNNPPAASATAQVGGKATQQSGNGQQGDGGGQQANGGGQQANGRRAFTIAGRRDGGLLTVNGGNDGSPVVVSSRGGQGAARNQVWTAVDVGDGLVALVAGSASGSVLEQGVGDGRVRIRSVRDGTRAVFDRQKWRLQDTGGGAVAITNADTGDCLSDDGTGQQARAVDCQDLLETQQRWSLTSNRP